jgi:hypothetical protein
MIHFWVIFVRGNKNWGWRAWSESTIKDQVTAYRTQKEAKEDLRLARGVATAKRGSTSSTRKRSFWVPVNDPALSHPGQDT